VAFRRRKRAVLAPRRTRPRTPVKPKPFGALTPYQQRLVADLTDSVADLRRLQGVPLDKLDDADLTAINEHDRMVLRAARAGLATHPLVAPRVSSWRAIGDRGFLRRARSGLEKGVRCPITPTELALISDIEARRAAGATWEAVRQSLVAERRLHPQTTRQAFHAWARRLFDVPARITVRKGKITITPPRK
jgi:hypothetical protein